MEKKIALINEFGFDAEALEFNLEDFSLEDLRAKLEEMKAAAEDSEKAAFALAEQFREELINALRTKTTETCFGEIPQYSYVDHDTESTEVYGYDVTDWKLYGFAYITNGDSVSVDFDSKKRKKFSIVDFDEGEQRFDFAHVFEFAVESFNENESSRRLSII